MNLNPMEQFAVKPILGLDKPLLQIGGHPIYFTNQALLMVIVFFVLGAAAGIRNVMRAAHEINAEIAKGRVSDDGNGKETGS